MKTQGSCCLGHPRLLIVSRFPFGVLRRDEGVYLGPLQDVVAFVLGIHYTKTFTLYCEVKRNGGVTDTDSKHSLLFREGLL
jgi:hypothetical protein